jgi:hypothetical protein
MPTTAKKNGWVFSFEAIRVQFQMADVQLCRAEVSF